MMWLMVLLLMLPSLVWGAVYCVDDTGGASGACNVSVAGDCSDVTEANRESRIGDNDDSGAQSCISPGDTILVFPGNYTVKDGIGDEFDQSNSGTSDANRTIIKAQDPANPPDFNFTFQFDGLKAESETDCSQHTDVPEFYHIQDISFTPGAGIGSAISVIKCAREIKLENIQVDGGTSNAISCFGTSDRSYTTCDIINSFVDNGGQRGILVQGDGVLLEGNSVTGSTQGSIYCQTCTNGTVRYNQLYDCQGQECLEITGLNAKVYGNVFHDCGLGDAIRVNHDDITVAFNTFYNCTKGILINDSGDVDNIIEQNIFDGVANPITDNGTNTVFDNNRADVSDAGIETVSDPSLVDPANDDFNLGTGSTAIDACAAVTGIPLTGNGTLDCGAMESPIHASAFATDGQTILINLDNNRNSPISTCDRLKITVTDGTNNDNPATCTVVTNQLTLDMTGTTLDAMTDGETLTYTTTYGWVESTLSVGTDVGPATGNFDALALAITSAQAITNQILGGPPVPTFTQRHYRWDDPILAEASAAGALQVLEDGLLVVPAGGGALLRIKVDATVADPNPTAIALEFRKNAGAYADVGDSCTMADVCITLEHAPLVTDGDAVTESLTASARAYVNGEAFGDSASVSVDMAQNEDREFVFGIRTAWGLTQGDDYEFRVKGLNTYTVLPKLTIGPYTWGLK